MLCPLHKTLRMTCEPYGWKISIKTRTCLLKGWGEAYIPSHVHCTFTTTFFITDKCWNGYKHEPMALDGWTSQVPWPWRFRPRHSTQLNGTMHAPSFNRKMCLRNLGGTCPTEATRRSRTRCPIFCLSCSSAPRGHVLLTFSTFFFGVFFALPSQPMPCFIHFLGAFRLSISLFVFPSLSDSSAFYLRCLCHLCHCLSPLFFPCSVGIFFSFSVFRVLVFLCPWPPRERKRAVSYRDKGPLHCPAQSCKANTLAAKKCGAKKTTHSHPPASLFSGAQALQGLLSIRRKSAGGGGGAREAAKAEHGRSVLTYACEYNVVSDALLQYVPCGDWARDLWLIGPSL